MATSLTILTSALLASLSVVLAMSLFKRAGRFDVDGRTAIVTGGSQGLGLAIAKQLSAKGAHVVIVAQNEAKLGKACNDVQAVAKSPHQKFKWLSYDLRSPKSAQLILEEVNRWNAESPVDIVINCAGHCIPGFLADTPVETLRDQMDTLYWTCTYFAHATINSWIKPVSKKEQQQRSAKPRHLIFTSSCLAFFPVAGYAPYSPAKAAMRALADTLNQEVQVYNGMRDASGPGPVAEIKVHAVFPMGIMSPGFDNEQKLKPALTQKLEEDDKPQDPDELAKAIFDELEAGKFMITGSFLGHLLKGCSIGASQRVGLMDYIWAWLGSVVILFVAPDFLSKCFRWGKTHGGGSLQLKVTG